MKKKLIVIKGRFFKKGIENGVNGILILNVVDFFWNRKEKFL